MSVHQNPTTTTLPTPTSAAGAAPPASIGAEADLRAKDALTNFSEAVVHAKGLLGQEEQRLNQTKLILQAKDKELSAAEEHLNKAQDMLSEAEARRARLQQQRDLRKGELQAFQQQLVGLQQHRKDAEGRVSATTAAVQKVQNDFTDEALSIQEDILRQLEGDNTDDLEHLLQEKKKLHQERQDRISAKKKVIADLKEKQRLQAELEERKSAAIAASTPSTARDEANTVRPPSSEYSGKIQEKSEHIQSLQEKLSRQLEQSAGMEASKRQAITELEAKVQELLNEEPTLRQRKEQVNEENAHAEDTYRHLHNILQNRACTRCQQPIEVPQPPEESMQEEGAASQSSQPVSQLSQTNHPSFQQHFMTPTTEGQQEGAVLPLAEGHATE